MSLSGWTGQWFGGWRGLVSGTTPTPLDVSAGIEARAIEAMYRRFHDRWPLVAPSVAYAFENEIGEAPSSPWARVSARHTTAEIATMGANQLIERRGWLYVQIFGDVDAGRAPLAELAALARQALEGCSLELGPGRLHLYEGGSRESPGDGRWALTLVSVPFMYR